ncbi:hypothetical protein [Nitrosopumilus sp.]|uniref:hypothetical protein n=1 Tax=Nitrosopumilus sp. TaxID=2024843 RepID=UPI00292E3A7B|nr:hypothetical protein [Nitrosopumilus sp.]
MEINCGGICHRYKAKKIHNVGRYISGQKRCNLCGIFIYWEGLFCPCCGYRLRMGPRNGKYKEKFLMLMAQRRDKKLEKGMEEEK